MMWQEFSAMVRGSLVVAVMMTATIVGIFALGVYLGGLMP